MLATTNAAFTLRTCKLIIRSCQRCKQQMRTTTASSRVGLHARTHALRSRPRVASLYTRVTCVVRMLPGRPCPHSTRRQPSPNSDALPPPAFPSSPFLSSPISLPFLPFSSPFSFCPFPIFPFPFSLPLEVGPLEFSQGL